MALLQADVQNITEVSTSKYDSLERELKSTIAAAASIEREKDAVEEEVKEARKQLEKARVIEKDLRAALKSEREM